MRCFIFVVFWFLLPAGSHASEAGSNDRHLNNASLSTSAHLPAPRFSTSTVKPWGFIDEEGQEDGLLVRFERELYLETGIAYENYLQPYPRVLHSLASGSVDFAIIFDPHAPREKTVRVGHVTTTEIIVVARAGVEPLASIDGLAKQRVGYIRGSKYGEAFDGATHFTRIPINTMKQGLSMLLNGRIDAMTSSDQSLYWAMERMGIDGSRLARVLILGGVTGGLYMSNSSRRQDLLPIYRKALQRMQAKGTMTRIFYQQDAWAAFEVPGQQFDQ